MNNLSFVRNQEGKVDKERCLGYWTPFPMCSYPDFPSPLNSLILQSYFQGLFWSSFVSLVFPLYIFHICVNHPVFVFLLTYFFGSFTHVVTNGKKKSSFYFIAKQYFIVQIYTTSSQLNALSVGIQVKTACLETAWRVVFSQKLSVYQLQKTKSRKTVSCLDLVLTKFHLPLRLLLIQFRKYFLC